MSNDLNTRLDALEAHIAHQDMMIQELNEVTTRQQTMLDTLNARIGRLLDRIGSLEPQGPLPANKPPHY
jgi:SlyX protein